MASRICLGTEFGTLSHMMASCMACSDTIAILDTMPSTLDDPISAHPRTAHPISPWLPLAGRVTHAHRYPG